MDNETIRADLLKKVIDVHTKIDQLFKELDEKHVIEEKQDTIRQCDVRLIAIGGIKNMLEHLACQISLLARPISFLNNEYYKKIERLRPKFLKIEEAIWINLLKDIKDIMDKKYDFVATFSHNDPNSVVCSSYLNPYELEKEEDSSFFISRLVENIVLASFMRIDNLFSHLVSHLDDKQVEPVQNQSLEMKEHKDKLKKKWNKLAKQLGLSSEDRKLLIEFSHIRNAMTHSNGVKKDGSLINSNFLSIISLLSGMINILEKVLSHLKIKEFSYISDTAAEIYINQQTTKQYAHL